MIIKRSHFFVIALTLFSSTTRAISLNKIIDIARGTTEHVTDLEFDEMKQLLIKKGQGDIRNEIRETVVRFCELKYSREKQARLNAYIILKLMNMELSKPVIINELDKELKEEFFLTKCFLKIENFLEE